MMIKIISKNNPIIVEIVKLKQAKHRKATGSFIIEGLKVIQMALDSKYIISKIMVLEDKVEAFSEIISNFKSNDIKLYDISKQVSDKIALSKNPQGIFAVVKAQKNNALNINEKLVIACEDLSDPGNLGTIIRTADAVRVKNIIINSGCVDIYNDKVIRASMGSLFNVNIISSSDFISDISDLKSKGYNIACGHLCGDDFFDREVSEKNVLIIANEAHGISDKVENICNSKWKLPMTGDAESLNAAVAAGIMMYDIMRKW